MGKPSPSSQRADIKGEALVRAGWKKVGAVVSVSINRHQGVSLIEQFSALSGPLSLWIARGANPAVAQVFLTARMTNLPPIAKITQQSSWRAVPTTLLTCGLSSLACFFAIRGWERRSRRNEARTIARQKMEFLRIRMLGLMEVLHSVAAFRSTEGEFSWEAFTTFVTGALDRHPNVLALAWNPRVPDRDRAGFEARGRRDVLPDFEFRELDPAGRLVRVRRRAEVEHQVIRWTRDLRNEIAVRERIERDLRDAERKYRGIFENSIEGIFQTTPDGRYLSANPALARIYGYQSSEELMADVEDIESGLYVEPNRRAEFIRLAQERGAMSDFESQVWKAMGGRIGYSAATRIGVILLC